MMDLAGGYVFKRQQIEKILQIDGESHIRNKTVEYAVVTPFKTGKSHEVKFTQFVKKV